MSSVKLTIKQENFCNAYVETGNASEAYRRTYNCSGSKPEIINVRACELLKKGNIVVRVKELQDELKKKSDFTKDEAISILSDIARSNIVDVLDIKNNNSFTTILVKDISTLPNSVQRAIFSLKSTDKGYEIKLYNKIDAIEKISKILGWDAPIKSESTTKVKMVIGDEQ